MSIDPDLYNTTSTSWERVRKPKGILPCPYRAELFEGWFCKDFIDDQRRLFQRRRRRGHDGTMMERWFIATEFKVELDEEFPDVPGEPEYLPPSEEQDRMLTAKYVISNMIYDFIEELDYAVQSGVNVESIRVLRRIRRRVAESRRILRELRYEPIEKPGVAEIPQTIQ